MPLQLSCPKCGATSAVPDAYAGKQGKCRKCGAVVQVPAATAKPAGDASPVMRSRHIKRASPMAPPVDCDPPMPPPPPIDAPPIETPLVEDSWVSEPAGRARAEKSGTRSRKSNRAKRSAVPIWIWALVAAGLVLPAGAAGIYYVIQSRSTALAAKPERDAKRDDAKNGEAKKKPSKETDDDAPKPAVPPDMPGLGEDPPNSGEPQPGRNENPPSPGVSQAEPGEHPLVPAEPQPGPPSTGPLKPAQPSPAQPGPGPPGPPVEVTVENLQKLFEENAKLNWTPKTAEDYQRLREFGRLATLAKQAERTGQDPQLGQHVDQLLVALRDLAWSAAEQVNPIDQFAGPTLDVQPGIAVGQSGLFFFGAVMQSATIQVNGQDQQVYLLQVIGTDRLVGVQANPMAHALANGTPCLVMGIPGASILKFQGQPGLKDGPLLEQQLRVILPIKPPK